MKRQKRDDKDKEPNEEPNEEPIYYNIKKYPTGGGYEGTNYIRLSNGLSKEPYGYPIKRGDIIEILWPDNSISTHKITTEIKNSSHYDSDACYTFHTANVYPIVDIECRGTIIKKIKLNEIDGIKARIIT